NGVVVSGGAVTVGGIVVDAVLRGCTLDVRGTAISTVLSSGTLTVDAGDGSGGGTADGTIIDSGGVMFVDPINNEFFFQPATVESTTINSGGIEYLESGANASGTIVNSGGTMILLDGAGLTGIAVNAGG